MLYIIWLISIACTIKGVMEVNQTLTGIGAIIAIVSTLVCFSSSKED